MTKLSKAASSLIYRLRSRGYRIDTKKRTIFVAYNKDNEVPDLSPLNRLRSEFGFQVLTSFTDDAQRARVYISGPIAHYDIDERKAAFKDAKKNYVRWVCFPSIPWTIAFRSQETGATTCALTLPTSSDASTSTSSQTGNTLKAVVSNSM